MKKIAFASLLFAIVTISACKKDNDPTTPSNPAQLGVDVQSFFNQTPVQILIDDKAVISKTLTTSLVVDYCTDGGKFLETIMTGDHQVKAIVNGTSYAESFLINKNHYIGVNYDSAKNRIWFVHSDTAFVYK